jgi:uncharacterized protein
MKNTDGDQRGEESREPSGSDLQQLQNLQTVEPASSELIRAGVDSAIPGVFDHVRNAHGNAISFDQIRDLNRRLAPSEFAFEKIWTHCQIVARIALGFAQQMRHDHSGEEKGTAIPLPRPWNGALPDLQLVTVGALVHDIGVYRVFETTGPGAGREFDRKRYIFHGLEGYLILLENRYGLRIASFARNHTGVGITRNEVIAQNLPLPPADYMPRTVEQEIVMYSDKFHTKSDPPDFVSLLAARRSAARFGHTNAARFDAVVKQYGNPDLQPLADEYTMRIRS